MKGYPLLRGAPAILALLFAVALTVSPAFAGDGDRGPVTVREIDLATVKVFSGGLDLDPNVRYSRAVLTVSGPTTTFLQEFDAYTRPSIGLFDPEGELLPDGFYTWELQLTPPAEIAEALRASASRNGGVAERPWLPKAGGFTIRNAAIALPDQFEAGERRLRQGDEEAFVRSRRQPVESQAFNGQLLGEKALGSRGPAGDTDEMALAGGGGEEALMKSALDAAPRALTPVSTGSVATAGLDSDRAALNHGGSIEKALTASERPVIQTETQKRTSPTDGKNGRPRTDR